jgi:hypothetical protein
MLPSFSKKINFFSLHFKFKIDLNLKKNLNKKKDENHSNQLRKK